MSADVLFRFSDIFCGRNGRKGWHRLSKKTQNKPVSQEKLQTKTDNDFRMPAGAGGVTNASTTKSMI